MASKKPPSHQGFDVSELARKSAVSVASIKFYLREGILQSGDLSQPSREYYDESHLTRLRLIRILRDVGKLPIKRIRDIVKVLNRTESVSLEGIGDALAALSKGGLGRETAAVKRAKAEVRAMLKEENINFVPDSPMVNELAHALAGVRRAAGIEVPIAMLAQYVKPMNAIATLDFRSMLNFIASGNMGHSETLGYAVVGTLSWEPVLLALRKILHEHQARALLGAAK